MSIDFAQCTNNTQIYFFLNKNTQFSFADTSCKLEFETVIEMNTLWKNNNIATLVHLRCVGVGELIKYVYIDE